jgi:hypothetical protein
MLTGADDPEHGSGDPFGYEQSIRSMIRALPIGSYASTQRAVDHVLDRTRGKLAATLVATLSHPDVHSYLENFERFEDGALEKRPYTPFAGVLSPILYGPHMDRSLRFFAPERVEPRAYTRSATIAQGLSHALEAERSGAHVAHYGALQWIASCARELGHVDSFDHFIVYFHDRHVHGRSDHGHDRLDRILFEADEIKVRSQELYAGLMRRDEALTDVFAPSIGSSDHILNAPTASNP